MRIRQVKWREECPKCSKRRGTIIGQLGEQKMFRCLDCRHEFWKETSRVTWANGN